MLYLFSMIFHTSAILVNGKSPGHHFWGVTNIAYMAHDRSGNSATCSFDVTVTGKTLMLYSICLNNENKFMLTILISNIFTLAFQLSDVQIFTVYKTDITYVTLVTT